MEYDLYSINLVLIKNNRNLLERESSENVNPNLLYHHIIVLMLSKCQDEGVGEAEVEHVCGLQQVVFRNL